jgi:hypothetical protein
VTVAYNRRTNGNDYRVYTTIGKAGLHSRERKLDKSAYVVRLNGIEPDLDGNIRSPLAAVVREHELYEETLSSARIIEALNTRQRLISDIPNTAAANNATTTTFTNRYAGMDPDEPGARFLVHARTRASDGKAALTKVNEETGVRNFFLTPEMLTLPEGKGFAAVIPPPMRNAKFLEQQERYANHVCAAYGVPRATLGISERSEHGSAFSDINNDTLRVTITGWIAKMSRLLTDTYMVIYMSQNTTNMARRIREQILPEMELTERDIYKIAVAASRVDVGVPFLPSLSFDLLKDALASRVLTFKEFFDNSRRILGFPQGVAPKEPTEPHKMFTVDQEQDPAGKKSGKRAR